MKTSKVIIDGVETNFILGIDDNEIEKNEEFTFNTLDLTEVVDKLGEKDK